MLGENKIIAFVPTTNLERARAFYTDLLGLRTIGQDDFAVIVQGGGTTIRIAKVDQFTPASFTVLGWEVTNIEAAAKTLGNHGIAFERYQWFEQDALGVWTAPSGGRVAWFKDPDGNVLSITEPPAG